MQCPLDQELRLERGPLPTVLLRHDLPDGSHHFDWMIGQNREGTLPLITFRLDQGLGLRLDELPAGHSVGAQRIADHRSLYLSYEGPIKDDRGIVRRLCGGHITAELITIDLHQPPCWELETHWNGLPAMEPATVVHQRLRLKPRILDQWIVFCVTIDRCRESQ